MSLNLSQMKKVASDKKTTSLKHPDGHIIVIMHSALPHLQRKALEKLPVHKEESEEKPKKMALGGLAGNPLITNVPVAPLPVQAAFPQVQVSTQGPQTAATTPAFDLGDWSSGQKPKAKPSDAAPASTGDSGLDIKLNSAFNNADTAGEAAKTESPLAGAFDQTMAEGGAVVGTNGSGAVAGGEVPKKTELAKINKFADGGDVEAKPKKKTGDDYLLQAAHSMVPDAPTPDKTAEEGGGLAKTISDYFKAKGGKIESCMHCGGVPKKYYDEGGGVKADTPADAKNDSEAAAMGATPDQQASNPNHITINVGQPAPGTQTIPAIANAPESSQIQTPVAPAATYPSGGGVEGQAQNIQKSVKEEQQAAGPDTQKVAEETGKLAADREAGYIKQRQAIAQQDVNNVQELATHVNDYRDYLNQHPIDAQRYLNNMGTGKYIRTAIGLALGGLAAPFGGHSTAYDMLQNNINRDIDEQKANTSNKQGLYHAYEALYGNQNIATNLAKASMLDIVSHQANLDTARLATPQAAINNKLIQAKIIQDKNQLLQEAGGILGNTRGAAQPKEDLKPGEVAVPGGTPDMQKANDVANKDNPHKIDMFKADPIEPILKPGSEKMLFGASKNPNVDKSQLLIQHAAAYAADKSLKQLPKTFNNLATETSVLQKFGGSIPHGLAGIGAVIGAKIGHPVAGASVGETVGQILSPYLKDDQTRRFATETQNLVGYISAALAGRGDQFVAEAVKNYLPDYNDSPQTLKAKYEGLQHYIKLHINTDTLKAGKLVNSED